MKKILKIAFALSLVFVMAFSFAACSEKNTNADTDDTDITAEENSSKVDTADDDDIDITAESGDYTAVIDIENYGKITLELYTDEAPKTVANFVKLAKSGFYDGLTFHRIMEGFMMQGGDPEGTGMGGSDETIVGEFSDNGYENSISHTRGTISMARNGYDYNSASSQFFIVHKDSTFLDGQYAAFGRVTDGIDVVDKVCEDSQPTDNNGTIPKSAQPVIKSITIVE